MNALTAILQQATQPQPTKAASAIWASRNPPHLEADAVTTRAKARLMLAQVRQLLPLVEQIAAYD